MRQEVTVVIEDHHDWTQDDPVVFVDVSILTELGAPIVRRLNVRRVIGNDALRHPGDLADEIRYTAAGLLQTLLKEAISEWPSS